MIGQWSPGDLMVSWPSAAVYDRAMVARRSDGSWPSAVGYDWATGAMVITFLRAVAWLSAVGYD